MTDTPRFFGVLVWIRWQGSLEASIYRSDDGTRPELDSLTKCHKVAEHDLFEKDEPWTLDEAIKAHPAPALVEEKA